MTYWHLFTLWSMKIFVEYVVLVCTCFLKSIPYTLSLCSAKSQKISGDDTDQWAPLHFFLILTAVTRQSLDVEASDQFFLELSLSWTTYSSALVTHSVHDWLIHSVSSQDMSKISFPPPPLLMRSSFWLLAYQVLQAWVAAKRT